MRPTSILIVAAIALFASTDAASVPEQQLSIVNSVNAVEAVDASKRFLRTSKHQDDDSDDQNDSSDNDDQDSDSDDDDDDDQNGEERMFNAGKFLMAEDDAVKIANSFTQLKGGDAQLLAKIQNTRHAEGRINNWDKNGLTLKQVKLQFGGKDAVEDMKEAIKLYAAVLLRNRQSGVAAP